MEEDVQRKSATRCQHEIRERLSPDKTNRHQTAVRSWPNGHRLVQSFADLHVQQISEVWLYSDLFFYQ